MNYGSICSGVEAATLAWRHLGWKAVFFSEIEPFPSAVLMARFGATRPLRPLDPCTAKDEKERKQRLIWQKQIAMLPEGGVIPNYGDLTLINKEEINGKIDLLVGGTPCQDLSLAGKRLGFAGRRSVLALDFVRLCFESNVRWVVWENVPSTLSSRNGEDFTKFLSLLTGWDVPIPQDGWRKCGIVTNAPGCFGVAWRILDAQYTRVEQFPRAIPQRRQRLFLVGYLGNWEYSAKVLFDEEMCGGNTPPSRSKGERFASGIEESIDSAKSIRMRAGCPGGGKGALIGDDLSHTIATGNDQTIVSFKNSDNESVVCLGNDSSHAELGNNIGTTLRVGGGVPMINGTKFWNGKDVAETLTTTSNNQLMPDKARLQCVVENAICLKAICYENHGNDSRIKEEEVSPVITGRAEAGGNNLPYEQTQETNSFIKNETEEKCFNVSFCDANGTRSDRPNGGLYVTKAEAGRTVTAGGTNADTVIVDAVALDGDKMKPKERAGGSGMGVSEEGVMYTQTAGDVHGVAYEKIAKKSTATVRKLLPVETERLMGFPDNYTRISWLGKPEEECPDAPRYKACGNSMCVNCMMWIGERIEQIEQKTLTKVVEQGKKI